MLIGGNGSAQDPSSLCAPVDFTMHADYQFMVPVDPSLVKILFRWNDGTGATDTLSGNWNAAGDSVYVSASHNYPPTDECSRTAEAILIYDGELCMSSGYQEQTFATWGTDEENSGILNTNPVVHYVCEGEDVIDFTFADNSTFNCNITIEPDRPNRYYRWVQFIYNTYNQGGDRIPNVTVRDAGGTVHNMTDAIGNNVGGLDGPILRIPIPADGPNQISFEISAPAGGVAGDIFEITMRNWNVCNPYDETPNDGNPPADAVNGDNTPIETTARIEIIAPPPLTYTSLYEFCTNDNFILSASAGTGDVRWYKDSTLDTLLHTGNTFNPSFSPYPVNPNIPGSYSFYVTSYEGFCESAPGVVNMIVYQSPETANAGLDQTICADSITLTANTPTAGTAVWSTTSSATIVNLNDSVTRVRDLEFGPNTFTWTITNAFCSTTDNVTITSDRKPSDADAGSDVQICDTNQIILDATPVDLAGSGLWDVIAGSGTVTNPTSAGSSFSNMSQGNNRLIWRAYSMYNACPVTIDTLEILLDLSAGVANAGIDRSFCETDQTNLSATGALNGGFGNWSVLSGAGTFTNAAEENSSVTNLNYGSNIFQWEISSLYGICPSDSDVVEVINYQSPGIADAGSDAAYCLVTTDTLDGNTPVAGNGSWHIFQNPSGVAPSFLPNNSAPNARISISPGNEGKYGLIWQLQNGSCLSFDTVFIDFGVPVPQANAGPDTISCGYSYAMQANSFSRGVGTWTYLNGPGSVAMNPNEYTANAVFSFTPGNEGFYEFEWELTSGACPPSRDTILIGIKEAPLAPVLTDYQTCGPDSFSINVATADIDHIVYWYESNTSATPFYVGNTFGTGILSNTSDYYVSIYDTLSDCESSREEQLITVDIIPDAPNMLADTLCGSGNASLLGIPVLPANLVIWYEDSEGTIPADSGLTYNTPVINSSGYFYSRAQNTNTGCISEVDSVEVKVWPDTPSPTVSTDSSCGPSDFILHATKNESENALFWYKPDGSLTGISDSLVTAVINSTQSYFVSEYDIITKCLSEQVELVVTINSLPPLPTISDTFNCGPSEFTLKPSANPRISDFYWYDSPVEGNLISIADSFQTDFLISGESYWISGYNSITGCEGSRKEVEVDIFPSPSVIDIIGPTVMLRDQSNVLFFTQGGRSTSDYTWTIPSGVDFEQDVNDFIRLGFPNIGTYTISVFETTEDGCIGEPAYHNITVLLDSIAVDIGDFQQGACTAESFEIKPWLYGGAPPYTYHWTGDIEYLSSTSDFFTTFSPPGTGNYKLYLEVIDLNLKVARDSVSITVFESPTTNILNTDTIACVGENYSIITAQTGAQPFTYLWTGPVHNLNNYAVSNPVYTPRQSDTVEFTYILTDAHKCKAYDTITIISDKPTADFSVLTLPGCSPLNVEFENNSKGATRYNWYFGDGTQTTATEPSHAYANTSVEIKYYDVKLVATSALGCTDEEIEYVMVWPN
ncbi:MAG: hypothetical protein JXP36_06200, partial [Bacteroidales bacterium]|nr:hypothetical protein [Bacteroidales bacterium]